MPVLSGLPPVVDTPGAGWVTAEQVAGFIPDGSPFSADDVADLTAMLMFAMTGGLYGASTDAVRPYRVADTCGCGGSGVPVSFPWSSVPRWVCGCGGPSYLELPGPVTAIGEVLVDGVALVADVDYRLVDGRFLLRVGGTWPCCQDLTVPSTEAGTWSITFTHGPGIPPGGNTAALLLGREVAKAAGGANDCALSGKVQNVTRDGVSAVLVVDPAFLAEGHTGIPLVDMWVKAVAPSGTNRGGTITLPDALRGLLRETPLAAP